jgi:thymidine kinase
MNRLIFYFSSMNSGKSLALLTKDFMLREKDQKTILLKPSIDSRTKKISSRLGLEKECITVWPDENIIDVLSKKMRDSDVEFDYVLVDEAQFLTREQVWQLSTLVDYYNKTVMCYGIKLNWQGNFFEGSEELMKISDELIQMDSYCRNTGMPALFHIKNGGSDRTVETGYEDMYDTVSRKDWREWYDEKT